MAQQEQLTFHLPKPLREALDKRAEEMGEDRETLINEVLEQYLAEEDLPLDRIRESQRQAHAGPFVPDAVIAGTLRRLQE